MFNAIYLSPNRIRLSVWFFVSLIFSNLGSDVWAEEFKIRYDELPQLIEERNNNVASGRLALDAAQAVTGHLTRSYLPEVGLHVGAEAFRTGPYSPTTQPLGGVDFSMNLFRGGKDAIEEDVNVTQASVAKVRSRQTFHDELAKAQGLYWEVAYQQEAAEIVTNTLQSNERGYQAANQRYNRGLVTKTDLLEFSIYRGQLQEALESSRHELQLLNISLRSILGLPETAVIFTETRIHHQHDDQLIKKTFKVSDTPGVALLNLNANIADLQTSKAKRWWVPELEIYGTYSLYTLRERFYPNLVDRIDIAVGVRLHIPLFDRFQGSVEVRKNSFLTASAEKQAEQKARTVTAQIQVTQGEMTHLHELIHISEHRISEGQSYLNQTIDEYNRGVKNSPDVLSAIERLQSFRRQYLDRRKDYNRAKVRLMALVAHESV